MTSEVLTASRQNSTLIVSVVINGLLAIVVAVLGVLYYQAGRDIEANRSSIAALQADLTNAKSDVAKEAAHAAGLKADLASAQTAQQQLVAQSRELQVAVETTSKALVDESTKAAVAQDALDKEKARLPALPVRVEYRKSAMGRGLVAILTNTSSLQLPVVMAAHNPTTNQTKRFTFQLAPGQKVDIGYLEGWQFASGDEYAMRSANFDIMNGVVP